MRTNGICLAENHAKASLHNGKLHKAKHKIAPYLLAGGLLLSNCLKGQELKNDSVNIAKTEPVEHVTQYGPNDEQAVTIFTIMALLGLFWASVVTCAPKGKNPPEEKNDDEIYIDFY